jgi:hypothetical protein
MLAESDRQLNLAEVKADVASAKSAKTIMRTDCDALFRQLARYLAN